MNRELPVVQTGFRKGRGTRDQIANIRWIIEKARKFQKNIYFCFIDYTKAFDCVDHNKLWKTLKEMGIPDHLTCLLRNLYAGQEAAVRTGHGTTDWFQIGKGVLKAVYCHPAYVTCMQSTSWEMLDWRKHKLESRFPGEISITSDMQQGTFNGLFCLFSSFIHSANICWVPCAIQYSNSDDLKMNRTHFHSVKTCEF